MRLRTEIEHHKLQQPIAPGDGLLLLGSCFTEHIGGWLHDHFVDVTCNPWGVLFNPASIASALDRVLGGGPYAPQLHLVQGRYYSLDHHGCFSDTDADRLTGQILDVERQTSERLASCRHLLVTWGTAWVYEYQGKVVANCHKMDASMFTRRLLGVAEIVDMWSAIIERMASVHLIFTVSPIRHVRDGLHGNQISKSTLLLAIDQLCRLYPGRVEYLPVYELFVDDLRDYRFYADDLVHPGSLGLQAVRELVSDCCFSPQMQRFMTEAEPIAKALSHRPSDAGSLDYQRFLNDTLAKREQLVRRFIQN